MGAGAGLYLRMLDQLAALADLRGAIVRRVGAPGHDGDDRVFGRRDAGGPIDAGVCGTRRVLLLRADRRRAGACDARGAGGDRRRDLPGSLAGDLAHMLATDLSDAEIVLGKLAARLLPVLGLVGCTWPVLAITSLLGGIDPR